MYSFCDGRSRPTFTYNLIICTMWLFIALCIFAIIFLILLPSPSTGYMAVPGPKYPPTKGEIWPKPQFENKTDFYYRFHRSLFNVTVTNNNCDILENAIKRYNYVWRKISSIVKQNRIYHMEQNNNRHLDPNYQGFLKELKVDLKSPCENYPHFDMNEQYNLKVSKISELTSTSIWGIIRGLETLTQLLYLSEDYQKIFINVTKINDYPSYKHRGILIDTGRHYLSLKNIFLTLDAMAMNKMNVLHWHIVDDQSFPYQSKIFPELSDKGAFHPKLVYTEANIRTVIYYARDRGIRVLPEFDIPGHTRSWGLAYPYLLTECYKNSKVISLGPLNPIHSGTYKLLEDLLDEVQQLFPDQYIHVGGDEVDMSCWKSNPELQRFMLKNHMTVNELHALFMGKVLPLLNNESIPMVWQEVYDENVPLSKDTLIQVWRYKWIGEMVKIVSAGHRVVYSSSWYLDYLKSSWEMFYKDDPRLMAYEVKPSANVSNIVGGEACMWGEMVDDSNIISRTWPRTSAVAERLWTGLDYKNPPKDLVTDYVRRRIEEQTCRMKQRDITAEPPNGPGFCVTAF